MKKSLASAFVLSLCLIVVSGCCAPSRDVSTPGKALLGHWKNTVPGMNPDLYYSTSQVTFEPKKSGEAYSVPYSIKSEDEKEFSLELTYQGSEQPTEIVFSKDRGSITVLPANMPELLRYEFVDTRRQP